MTWLGIDLGKKRSGIAFSESGLLATPWGIIEGNTDQQIEQILKLVDQRKVTGIVIGQPSKKFAAQTINSLIDTLKLALGQHGFSGPVITIDEYLTTKEAERLLYEAGRPTKDSDALAARLILEDYLIRIKPNMEDERAE